MTRPHALYRYRPMASQVDRERAQSIVEHSHLYFATPLAFDDPFEARFVSAPDASFAEEFRASLMTDFSACCFTEPMDHPLLWSLYADGHRGICLEFSTTDPDSPLVHAERVSYSDEFPRIHCDQGTAEERARRVFLQKARAWEHQREWRVLGPNAPGAAPFKPEILQSVILGCRATEETLEVVTTWLQRRKIPCRLRRAEVEQDAYGLRIVDVETSAA